MNGASSKPNQGAAGPLIPVLAVVGVGLIGGSFAAALRRAGQVGRVLGVGRNAASLARAVELGLIDEAVSAEDAAARDESASPSRCGPTKQTKEQCQCTAQDLRTTRVPFTPEIGK